MSIWLALWLVLSFVLLAFFAWSLYIILKQKRTWKMFAAKHKLRYAANSLMQGPEIDGLIGDYKFSFFTSEHMTNDMRNTRKLTAIEVTLKSKMPMEGGVASASMVSVLKELGFREEIKPEHEGWNKTFMAAASHGGMLSLYLTPERLEILTRLMKIKNAWIIFVFRGDMTLLRVDTSNPLVALEPLEKLVKVLSKAAAALELNKGEAQLLKAEEARNIERKTHVTLEEGAAESGVSALGFELEEDEDEAAPAPTPTPEASEAPEEDASQAPSDTKPDSHT